MNNNMNRTFCNTNMPADAISVPNVQPGMRITLPYSVDKEVHTVVRVTGRYDRVAILTDKTIVRARRCGSVRLVTDEPYNYHSGHGCIKDV